MMEVIAACGLILADVGVWNLIFYVLLLCFVCYCSIRCIIIDDGGDCSLWVDFGWCLQSILKRPGQPEVTAQTVWPLHPKIEFESSSMIYWQFIVRPHFFSSTILIQILFTYSLTNNDFFMTGQTSEFPSIMYLWLLSLFSRRWKREQSKAEMSRTGFPRFESNAFFRIPSKIVK